ncbi:MAG: hypothetical protein QXP02_03855 [Desulfurococcaceae archaeon]
MINEIEEKMKVFVSELKYVKSIDGYMVKLSTLVYDLENTCLGDYDCVKDKLIYVLRHPFVAKELSNLACYKDEILNTIETNPRFKNLRKYINVVEEAMKDIQCIERRELERSRDATFRIEHEETNIHGGTYSKETISIWKKPVKFLHKTSYEKIVTKLAIAISIILFIVSLLILILR